MAAVNYPSQHDRNARPLTAFFALTSQPQVTGSDDYSFQIGNHSQHLFALFNFQFISVSFLTSSIVCERERKGHLMPDLTRKYIH
jgi:hypothetical protein